MTLILSLKDYKLLKQQQEKMRKKVLKSEFNKDNFSFTFCFYFSF